MKAAHLFCLTFVTFAMTLAAPAAAETYTIDPVHSSVAFSIRRFVSPVVGKFTRFSGAIQVDRANLERSSAQAVIEVASIDTNSGRRDTHLRSADFLDAAKFPTMAFKSKTWKKTGTGTFEVTGDLTIKDVTKNVVLKVTLVGFHDAAPGAISSEWNATTTINKAAFHVKDPPTLDAMIGDEVTITLQIEAGLAMMGGAR